MRNSKPPRSLGVSRRVWLVILVSFVLLAPLLLLTATSAQRRGLRQEKTKLHKKNIKEEQKRDEDSQRRSAMRNVRAPLQGWNGGSAPEPISSQAVKFAESRPARDVAKLSRRTPGRVSDEEESEAEENRVTRVTTPQARADADDAVLRGIVKDTVLQSNIPEPLIPAPVQNFEGLGRTENIAAGFGSLSPPDTNGDVGPNHYVQQDNLLVRVWDKTGTPLTAPFKLSTLFTPLGGTCAASDKGDPIVLYDQLADRWMLSQFGYTNDQAPPFFQCIAISKTNDPTGAYYLYAFQTPGAEFPDYPHLGVWPDGYYMMDHQFTEPGDNYNGVGTFAFDRVKMLAGDPTATYIYFNLSLAAFPEAIGGMMPSDLDGMTPPPAGRANTFAYFTTTDFSDPANGLRLFDFHADYATPANSTFTERAESTYAAPLPVAPFSVVNPATAFTRAAVPQPPPATAAMGLDAIADRIMFRMQYRNRGGFETLVFTHTVGAPASTTFGTFRAAPRYYELRSTASGPFSVFEQATYAPADGVSRWMGSAAEDNQGNLAVGFSASSTSVFPSIRYAGRLATDPAGGLAQGENNLIAGTGVQTSTGSRWGDYSALTVDPSDDCTFWYTTEYYTAAGQAASAVGWQTRIGSFKFATCTAPAKGTAHFTVTNCATAANIQNAVVTIDGITYGVSAANGTYDAPLAPGSHTYSVTKAGSSIASGNFNITNGNTTNVLACIASGTAHFVVTDCTSAAAISGAAVSVDGNAVGTTNASGLLDVALAPGSHNYTISKTGYAPTSNSFNITDGTTTNVPACLQGVPIMVANGASLVTDTNANGAIDPGETVTVSFGLKNNGAGATSNLVGTLQATGGVTSPGAPANYGVVAANGGTGAKNISFTADAGLTCGSTLTATLQLQDGATNLGNVTYNFTLCPIVVVTATAATVGPTSYPTLKAAFDAINAGTHQGAVTVSINSSTTEGTTPATLNGSGAGSASYTSIQIRPVNDGISVSGNPAGGFGVIQLNGASNVTIDGDNPNTVGTNRNLTVQNTASNTTTFNSVVRIALATTGATAANNDIIKNLIVLGSATGRNVSGASSTAGSENTTYGILAASGSAGATAAPSAILSISTSTIGSPATATNLLIQNNSITTTARAIAIHGSAVTVFPGLQIKDNVIGNPTAGAVDQVYANDILVNGTADGIVSGNTLYLEGFITSSNFGANQAVSVGVLSANTNGVTVEKNRVLRVRNNATDTWPAVGINLGGGNNHIVQNNFVSDIMNNMVAGAGGGGTTFGAYGIRVASGTGHKIYHNSVHLFGVLPGASSTNLTVALMIVNTTQTGMDVRNNLFSNEQTGGNPTTTNTRHAVIFLPSGATSAMNLTLNNNAYLQGPAVTGALSLLAKVGTAAGTGQFFAADFNAGTITPATNLRSYTSTLSAAGTNDNASTATALAPPFVSNTDLHIPNGTVSPLESGGAGVGVTTDIDNQTRPGPPGSVNGGGTAPDMGADEFDGIIGPFAVPSPTPTPTPTPAPTPGPCAPFVENFDNVATLTTTGGWVNTNNSTTIGTFTWGQGNPTVFPAQAGATNAYASVNFESTTGTNDISNWLITPPMTLRDGNRLTFWTRTTDVGANLFPDRLQVRMSTNGASTNVGSTAASVGDFTTLLLDINPTYADNYPHVWTKFVVTVNGLGTPTVGRFAFRYFVEGGGPDASRSDYIGIDTLDYNCTLPTAAPASLSGRITAPDGTASAGVTMNLTGARSARAITDSNGAYRFSNLDTNSFYTVTPSLTNYHFAPEDLSFSLLANKSDAGFTANRDPVTGGNVIDSSGFFVRQHYLDFLGREPDESGFNFWTDQIIGCGSDTACVDRRTINVSAAYFLSIEFQQTGGLVDSLYRATYDRRPTFAEFMPDQATVARNVIVGQPDWTQILAGNKDAFVAAWAQRPEFHNAYDSLTNRGYVDKLLAHSNGFNGNRDALISGLESGALTRVAVLRQIVDNEGFTSAKRNAAFVMMQYFGYLRRDPDESGYQFWLNKLNQFNGNFEQAEMVKAFIVSGEYRARFAH